MTAKFKKTYITYLDVHPEPKLEHLVNNQLKKPVIISRIRDLANPYRFRNPADPDQQLEMGGVTINVGSDQWLCVYVAKPVLRPA